MFSEKIIFLEKILGLVSAVFEHCSLVKPHSWFGKIGH